ncbi:MAG: NlpC/P60 family protein [Actinomycetes bacterium]
MATPPGAHRRTRSALVALCTAAVATVTVVPTTMGHADPGPSIREVQRKVEKLNHKAEQAAERYNDARERRKSVEARLDALQHRVNDQQAEVDRMQSKVGGLAAATYRNGGFGSEMRLILSDDPRQFIEQATALEQVSRQQGAVLRHVVEAKRELAADQRLLAAQQAALAKIRRTLHSEKRDVEKQLDKAEQVLGSLEAEQRARLEAQQEAAAEEASSVGSYTGPASGRARVAVEYAYAQLGDSYEYGATGPSEWDCSGLTMMAWNQAGVSLPHSSSMQYEQGRKVARSDLQPGDLVFFYQPVSHVGIYVGGGNMIHASNESSPVKMDPISYMPEYTGATRP